MPGGLPPNGSGPLQLAAMGWEREIRTLQAELEEARAVVKDLEEALTFALAALDAAQ